MTLLNENILPYVGTDTFKLGDNLCNIRQSLKHNKIKFNQRIDPNKGCEPEVPWIFIEIENCITLCFAKDILFEIVLENDYTGKLPNGVFIGMKMSELEEIDKSLKYNEDDEDFVSKNGYWIEDDLDTGKICSITIFLPEVDSEDFFKYEWIDNYNK